MAAGASGAVYIHLALGKKRGRIRQRLDYTFVKLSHIQNDACAVGGGVLGPIQLHGWGPEALRAANFSIGVGVRVRNRIRKLGFPLNKPTGRPEAPCCARRVHAGSEKDAGTA